jgi:hypothetical protein
VALFVSFFADYRWFKCVVCGSRFSSVVVVSSLFGSAFYECGNSVVLFPVRILCSIGPQSVVSSKSSKLPVLGAILVALPIAVVGPAWRGVRVAFFRSVMGRDLASACVSLPSRVGEVKRLRVGSSLL